MFSGLRMSDCSHPCEMYGNQQGDGFIDTFGGNQKR